MILRRKPVRRQQSPGFNLTSPILKRRPRRLRTPAELAYIRRVQDNRVRQAEIKRADQDAETKRQTLAAATANQRIIKARKDREIRAWRQRMVLRKKKSLDRP